MMKLKSIEIDLNDCEAVNDDLKNVNGLCPLIHVTFDNNGKDKAFTGRLLAFSFQKGNPVAAGHFMFVYKSVQNGKTFTTYCHKEELKISAEDLYALVMQNFEKKSNGNLIKSAEHKFSSTFSAIEGMWSYPSSNPGIAGDINPYAQIDQNGNFEKKSPGEELAEKLVEMCF